MSGKDTRDNAISIQRAFHRSTEFPSTSIRKATRHS